jgi:hypothetical protein
LVWTSAFGAEHTAPEQVQVQVVDGHARRVPNVEREAVPRLPDALHAGDILRQDEDAGEQLGVVPLDLARGLNVLFGIDQAMHRRARADVANGEGVFVLGDLLYGNLPSRHSAKEAVLHLHR